MFDGPLRDAGSTPRATPETSAFEAISAEAQVLIVSARVGAGHDGAARQLSRVFTDQGLRVRRVDLLDLLPYRLGTGLLGFYQRQMRIAPRSWDGLLRLLATAPATGLAQRVASLAAPRLRAALGPETIRAVSTYPLASHALAQLRARGELAADFTVYLTDPAVHPLSITPAADATVAPNRTAARQAAALGAPRTIVRTPLTDPTFRPPASTVERQQARALFGLPAAARLALVSAGSWAVGEVAQTARDIAATQAAEPVVLCARNTRLRTRLRAEGFRFVLGWVDHMPELLRACDIVVQNAGGLSTSEALATGLPVLTYRCLPGHGRANAAVLHAEGLVPWVHSPDHLAAALRRISQASPAVHPLDTPA